jgi:molybdate transport system regulatory protein
LDKKSDIAVQAPLWMQKNNQNFLGEKRISLLEQIDIHGSLSTAAKAAEISYKAAWDALNVMNNLAERPLTIAATGGSGGGGTILTDEGKKVIQLFRSFEQEHQNSLIRLEKTLGDIDHYLPLLQGMNLRISAKNLRISTKNIFTGVISDIVRDISVAQVALELKSGHQIYAVISNDSIDELKLEKGSTASALIKASSVMISNAPEPLIISAKNMIRGKISTISENVVQGEVSLDIGGGDTITSTITQSSVKRLGLKVGDEAWAIIKTSSVIIGVDQHNAICDDER